MIHWLQFMPGLSLLLIAALVAFLERSSFRKGKSMSAASDRVTASLAALTTSVEALLARPVPTDDTTAETAAADALDALKVKVDAALAPAAPVPPAAT